MARRIISSEEARELILQLWCERFLSEKAEVDRDSVRKALTTEFYERLVPAMSDRAHVHLNKALKEELEARKPEIKDPEEAQAVIDKALEIADEVLEEEAKMALDRAARKLATDIKRAIDRSLRG